MAKTKPFNVEEYIQRITNDPCFICAIVAGSPDYPHHLIYQDHQALVFLNKYPPLYGYVLVCPLEHREQVSGDFTLPEYLALQKLIYQVTEAVRQVLSPERVYILSLGSQQGNSHVHWHIAPLPPGVDFHDQQLQALDISDGILDLSEQEMAQLAQNIRQKLLPIIDRIG